MARSLNKVELIGNLTRDPELRYTPQGTAVCTFGIATNRGWVTDSGEKKEEAEFHRIVAWNKLAELCSQLLTKGRKIYVEGRLANRSWTGQDGAQKSVTEIVINDMIILDNRRDQGEEAEKTADFVDEDLPMEAEASKPIKKAKASESPKKTEEESPEVNPDDIPF
ncbi:MAG TPA: single-stranded DNA-binding protein [Patescibacteria group bacterium]|nr:single-stranded DNA-binding protein [Patescibacteria group bacterium]